MADKQTGPVEPPLPHNRLYAVRHGQTGKLWVLGAMWHWSSPRALQDAWKLAREHDLVKGDLRDHRIIEIHLREAAADKPTPEGMP